MRLFLKVLASTVPFAAFFALLAGLTASGFGVVRHSAAGVETLHGWEAFSHVTPVVFACLMILGFFTAGTIAILEWIWG